MNLEISPTIFIAFVWTLAWKGVALWKSARKNHIYWFVIFLALNTFGALPIVYLIWMRIKDRRKGKNKILKKKVSKKKK